MRHSEDYSRIRVRKANSQWHQRKHSKLIYQWHKFDAALERLTESRPSSQPSTKPIPAPSARSPLARRGSCWSPRSSPRNAPTCESTWSRRSYSAASLPRRRWPRQRCRNSKLSSGRQDSFATKPSRFRELPARSSPTLADRSRRHLRS